MVPINKTTVVSSLAIIGGIFIYKQYIESHVLNAMGGSK